MKGTTETDYRSGPGIRSVRLTSRLSMLLLALLFALLSHRASGAAFVHLPAAYRVLQHQGSVSCVAYSPDGTRLATTSEDGTVRLWEVGTWKAFTVMASPFSNWSLAFSPDGSRLYGSGVQGVLSVWDGRTGAVLAQWPLPVDHFTCVACSPDGRLLAAVNQRDLFWLLDTKTGKVQKSIHRGGTNYYTVAFSNDGKTLAAGGHDNALELLDLASGEHNLVQSQHGDIQSLAPSPDGKQFAAAEASEVGMRDSTSGKLICSLAGACVTVAFSPDGRLAAAANNQNQIRLWEPATGRTAELRGHTAVVRSLAFSPDGLTLASGGDDSIVRLWDLRDALWRIDAGGEVPIYGDRPTLALEGRRGQITADGFSPDGRWLITGGADHRIRVWNTESGEEMLSFPGLSLPAQDITALPDSRTMVCQDRGGDRALFDFHTGALLQHLPPYAGLISPDGKMRAVRELPDNISLVNLETGITQELTGKRIGRIRFSPDSSLIAAGCADSCIRVWSTKTGELLWLGEPQPTSIPFETLRAFWIALGRHQDEVLDVAISPDGRTLASAHQRGTVRFWNARTGLLETVVASGEDAVFSLAYSPDGKWLAADAGSVTEFWDAGTRKLRYRTVFGSFVGSFSADSRTFSRVDDSGKIFQFDLETGKLRRSPGPGAKVTGLAVLTLVQGGLHEPEFIAGPLPPILGAMNSGSNPADLRPHVLGPEGSPLIASVTDEGKLCLWNAHTGAEEVSFQSGAEGFVTAAASRDGHRIATASEDHSIRLWSAATGQVTHTFLGHKDPIRCLQFSPDGTLLASTDDQGRVNLWDTAAGENVLEWDWDSHWPLARRIENALDFVHRHRFTGALFTPDGKDILLWYDEDVQLRDVRSWALLKSVRLPRDVEFTPSVATDGAISPDGATAAFACVDGRVRTWDLRTGAIRIWQIDGDLGSLAFSPDGFSLAVMRGQGNPEIRDVRTEEIKMALGGSNTNAGPILFSPDGKQVFTSSTDGTIHVFDVGAGRLQATLLSAGKEWLAATPEGFFDCSANAASLVRWEVDGQVYAGEQYLRRFRRPDLVQQALRGEPLRTLEMSVDDIPPEVHFTGIQVDKQGQEATVTVEALGHRPLADVQLMVNGRPILPGPSVLRRSISNEPGAGARPIEVTDKPIEVTDKSVIPGTGFQRVKSIGTLVIGSRAIELGSRPIELGSRPMEVTDKPLVGAAGKGVDGDWRYARSCTFRMRLPASVQDIHIRTVAYDHAALGSVPEEIRLHRRAVHWIPGNLYALCIGISQYENGIPLRARPGSARSLAGFLVPTPAPSFTNAPTPDPASHAASARLRIPDLNFPALDAAAMAQRLRREGHPLYARVAVHTLMDGQATLANIRKQMEWLQKSVRPGQVDTVVIFLSGHGVSDPGGHYFFPAADFDPAQGKATCLSGQELQDALGGKLPARDVFLFADTCHSGALAGARTQDLGFEIRSSGVYLMASTGASQYAYESPRWGHGAFTLAMLRALARKDLGPDRIIRFNALARAVPEELTRLLKAAGQAGLSEQPVVPLEGRSVLEPVAQVR